jgi:hypothetical protein
MILRSAEQGLTVAAIVRESGETVRRWGHRYKVPDLAADVRAEGTAGDDPNPHAADAALWARGGRLA